MIRTALTRAGCPQRGNRRSFTLIELLVVVAIIAVLAGLLLPALKSARVSGQRAKCLSNIRQILLACSGYANDNGTAFPAGVTWSGDANDYHCVSNLVWLQDLLTNYLSGSQGQMSPVFRCPSIPVNSNSWINYAPQASYRYNICNAGQTTLSTVKDPTSAVLLYDLCWTDWQPSQFLHGTINLGFVDGHCGSLLPSQLTPVNGSINGFGDATDPSFTTNGWK